MTAAGYPTNFTTIARWKRDGWRANSKDDHPLDIARSKLESNAPLVTGNPAAEIGKRGEDDSFKTECAGLSDAALLRREARELCISSIEVKSALEQHLKRLVRKKPAELAQLYQALAECSQAILSATLQAEKIEFGPSLAGTKRIGK